MTALLGIMAPFILGSCRNAEAKQEEKNPEKSVVELSEETFNKYVYDMKANKGEYLGTVPAIVDFTASWCGPCQRISPILEELAAEYGDEIVIYKVDIDKNRELAKSFDISSIPAILYIPLDGTPVMTIGFRDKGKFIKEINTLLLAK